jgi:hypothetical protein
MADQGGHVGFVPTAEANAGQPLIEKRLAFCTK